MKISLYWVYFNPDAENGDGAFVEKYITEEDIYAAYKAREEAKNEADGRNAFINYIFENCRENTIDTSTAYFEDYANDYINRPENTAEFYGIGAESIYVEEVNAFITLLEENCPSVVKDKQAEKSKNTLDLDSDNIEIEGSIIKERKLLSEEGIVSIIFSVGKNGLLITSPNIITRGFIYVKNTDAIMKGIKQKSEQLYNSIIKNKTISSRTQMSNIISYEVSNFIQLKTERKPIIQVIYMDC